MKNNVVQFLFVFIALVVGAAIQDMAPMMANVKPPVLAAAFLYVGVTKHSPSSLAAALVAGAFVDALSGLSGLCTSCFFLIIFVFARAFRRGTRAVPRMLVGAIGLVIMTPLLEVWTHVWSGRSFADSVCMHLLSAAAIGFITGGIVFCVLRRFEYAAGIPPIFASRGVQK